MPPLLVLGLIAGCGSDDSTAFDEEQSREVFDLSNAEIHELHREALALPAFPEAFERPCAEGGVVTMQSVFDADGDVQDILHVLVDCRVPGYRLGGNLDYLAIEMCGDGSISLRMQGELEVTDLGACPIDAVTLCGVTSGDACGHDL